MGGLHTHAYMPGEWSAGMLEVTGGHNFSMVLTWACFLPTLDYLWSRPSYTFVFIPPTTTVQEAHCSP